MNVYESVGQREKSKHATIFIFPFQLEDCGIPLHLNVKPTSTTQKKIFVHTNRTENTFTVTFRIWFGLISSVRIQSIAGYWGDDFNGKVIPVLNTSLYNIQFKVYECIAIYR